MFLVLSFRTLLVCFIGEESRRCAALLEASTS
jgi:hypothetical protein